MINPSEIREQMKIIGSDSQPIGTVEKVEGNRIKLQGQQNYIPLDACVSVQGNTIRCRQTAQEMKQQWQGSATGRGAGGGKS